MCVCEREREIASALAKKKETETSAPRVIVTLFGWRRVRQTAYLLSRGERGVWFLGGRASRSAALGGNGTGCEKKTAATEHGRKREAKEKHYRREQQSTLARSLARKGKKKERGERRMRGMQRKRE